MQLTLTSINTSISGIPGDASALAAARCNDVASPAPLVLLHGWGLDRRVWQLLLPHLHAAAPHLPVYLADLPGYHGSAYAGEDAQAVAHALATQLPPGCMLAGWSLGGLLAQLAAVQPGSRIARLEQAYERLRTPHGLPLSYQVIYLLARAGDVAPAQAATPEPAPTPTARTQP